MIYYQDEAVEVFAVDVVWTLWIHARRVYLDDGRVSNGLVSYDLQ